LAIWPDGHGARRTQDDDLNFALDARPAGFLAGRPPIPALRALDARYKVLAARKPMLLSRLSGSLSLRTADRQLSG
jgi:hypothetical protein